MTVEYPYFPCVKGKDPLGAWSCELSDGHSGNCLKPAVPTSTDGTIAEAARLEQLLSHAERVITFAVARLDVLTYPGWPFEALFALGAYYRDLKAPDNESQRKRELGLIWLDFAREAEIWEKARHAGIHKELLRSDNLKSPAVSLLAHAVPEQMSVPKRNTKKKASKKKVRARKGAKSPKK